METQREHVRMLNEKKAANTKQEQQKTKGKKKKKIQPKLACDVVVDE